MTAAALLNIGAFLAALYICGAAICRVRHARSSIRPAWLVLYVAVFALAAWLGAAVISDGVNAWSSLTGMAIAVYVRLTASSWEGGVPAIARRQPAAEAFPDVSLPQGRA
jgi:uncharacterized membrane protein YcaP (DUF421 family)